MVFTCKNCLFAFFLVGLVKSQNSNDLDVNDIEKKVKEISGFGNFNSSNLPTVDDLEKIVHEKCLKNGGDNETFYALQVQQTSFRSCLEEYINTTQVQLELEEAKKTGSMDDVFGKYCKKYPEIYKCIESLTETMKPCLDSNEQEAMMKTLNVTNELKEFICYKDGDRIAMFIAEGGVECLKSRQEALQNCVNKTMAARMPKELALTSLPVLLFGENECKDFEKIRSCVNVELEKCKDSTPANIIDASFKFLKKHIPCDNEIVRHEAVKKSTGFRIIPCIVLMTVPMVFKLFF